MATTAKSTPAIVSELEAAKLAEAISSAPAWRPDAEPDTAEFIGEVIGLYMTGKTTSEGGYGRYPAVVYKLDNGSYRTVHAFHTLLRQQLAELKTEIGKRQFLAYRGTKRKNNATQEEIDKGLADYHVTFVHNIGEEIKPVSEDFAF